MQTAEFPKAVCNKVCGISCVDVHVTVMEVKGLHKSAQNATKGT